MGLERRCCYGCKAVPKRESHHIAMPL